MRTVSSEAKRADGEDVVDLGGWLPPHCQLMQALRPSLPSSGSLQLQFQLRRCVLPSPAIGLDSTPLLQHPNFQPSEDGNSGSASPTCQKPCLGPLDPPGRLLAFHVSDVSGYGAAVQITALRRQYSVTRGACKRDVNKGQPMTNHGMGMDLGFFRLACLVCCGCPGDSASHRPPLRCCFTASFACQ